MSTRSSRRRAGFTVGNTLVVLSLLSLVFATTYPRLRRLAFERRFEAVATDIVRLNDAARALRAREGSWPSDSPTGTMPPELVGALPPDFSFAREDLTISWNVWRTVRAPRPPEVDDANEQPGGIETEPVEGRALNPVLPATPDIRPQPETRALASVTIHSEDALLLAALFARFGPNRSFVHDGNWTLIVMDEA